MKPNVNFIRVIKNSSFNQIHLLNSHSEYLLVLLVAVQLYVLVLRSLDMKGFTFLNVSIPVLGVTYISNLPKVCVKIMLSSRPTHPVPFTSKCQIC